MWWIDWCMLFLRCCFFSCFWFFLFRCWVFWLVLVLWVLGFVLSDWCWFRVSEWIGVVEWLGSWVWCEIVGIRMECLFLMCWFGWSRWFYRCCCLSFCVLCLIVVISCVSFLFDSLWVGFVYGFGCFFVCWLVVFVMLCCWWLCGCCWDFFFGIYCLWDSGSSIFRDYFRNWCFGMNCCEGIFFKWCWGFWCWLNCCCGRCWWCFWCCCGWWLVFIFCS